MEKDEGVFADLPVSLHHGLKMELYIVEGHIHKLSVYYRHSVDQCSPKNTVYKYSWLLCEGSLLPPHCCLYCGSIALTTIDLHILY